MPVGDLQPRVEDHNARRLNPGGAAGYAGRGDECDFFASTDEMPPIAQGRLIGKSSGKGLLHSPKEVILTSWQVGRMPTSAALL